MRRVLTIALCAAALIGCGRKSEQPQPSSSAFEATPAVEGEQKSGGSSLFGSSCPALPAKSAVEAGLKSAMVAIYGPDEATMRFTVSTMTPGSDCKTVTVDYKGAGSPSTAPMTYDGEKWSLTLFNKPYPVP
jgi:hypothetical protein